MKRSPGPFGRFGGASARGAAHIQQGRPNQDAYEGMAIGGWIVISVADGHGAANCFRSDRGARLATKAARDAIAEFSDNGSAGIGDIERLRAAAPGLPAKIVERWRSAVADDASADPHTDLDSQNCFLAYGSTCVTAALAQGLSLFLQIGDGGIVAAGADNGFVRPLDEDEGLVGQQTYSLCLPDAASRFRWALFSAPHPLAAPEFVMAATDGLTKSFPDPARLVEVAQWLRQVQNERGVDDACKVLAPWLSQVSQSGARDDTSLMIFARPATVAAGATPGINEKSSDG